MNTTNDTMGRWTGLAIACATALVLALGACDEGDDDDDDDDGGDASNTAGGGSGATAGGSTASGGSASGGSASGGDSGDSDRVCTIIDTSISDCDVCAAESCCTAAEACGADSECNACYFMSPVPAECYENAALKSFADCVNGPCYASCNPTDTGSGSGTGSSNTCGDISCGPDGPNSTCEANGCGDCSFGKCLIF